MRMTTEDFERQWIAPEGTRSFESSGRYFEEGPCEIRTCFQRDRDRIIHSKAFRRLKHKTQVFLSPEGDHYRTRLTHTLEVAQISRTIARALHLNEDLTEAIALGHDLGHTPFGHSGEDALHKVHPSGFRHNEQSLRVVSFLENKPHKPYRGLNLTKEVLDGILHHNGPQAPFTLEGQIVKICDRIAYINHDIDDAIRAGVLKERDIPKDFFEALGHSHSERINNMIMDIVNHSQALEAIDMSPAMLEATTDLRRFMFREVYLNPQAKAEEKTAKAMLIQLYHYFSNYPEELPEEYFKDYQAKEGIEAVKDYIAGMTDRYAVKIFEQKFIPKFWK